MHPSHDLGPNEPRASARAVFPAAEKPTTPDFRSAVAGLVALSILLVAPPVRAIAEAIPAGTIRQDTVWSAAYRPAPGSPLGGAGPPPTTLAATAPAD